MEQSYRNAVKDSSSSWAGYRSLLVKACGAQQLSHAFLLCRKNKATLKYQAIPSYKLLL